MDPGRLLLRLPLLHWMAALESWVVAVQPVRILEHEVVFLEVAEHLTAGVGRVPASDQGFCAWSRVRLSLKLARRDDGGPMTATGKESDTT